jgi:hypothetical protein
LRGGTTRRSLCGYIFTAATFSSPELILQGVFNGAFLYEHFASLFIHVLLSIPPTASPVTTYWPFIDYV